MGTLFCGFLVLATSMLSTIDGFCRRWVDVIWTASAKLRELPTSAIKYVYFSVLVGYCLFGTTVIWLTEKPGKVFELATTGYNFAFAISCWHTLFVNGILLPRELRPHPLIRAGLVCGGCYFIFLGTMAVLGLARCPRADRRPRPTGDPSGRRRPPRIPAMPDQVPRTCGGMA